MDWLVTIIVGGVVGWLGSIVAKTNAQMGLIAEGDGYIQIAPKNFRTQLYSRPKCMIRIVYDQGPMDATRYSYSLWEQFSRIRQAQKALADVAWTGRASVIFHGAGDAVLPGWAG
jgi:hypothetical protein